MMNHMEAKPTKKILWKALQSLVWQKMNKKKLNKAQTQCKITLAIVNKKMILGNNKFINK